MILNGLALGGSDVSEEHPPSVLAGISLPPMKSLTVSGSAEMVEPAPPQGWRSRVCGRPEWSLTAGLERTWTCITFLTFPGRDKTAGAPTDPHLCV